MRKLLVATMVVACALGLVACGQSSPVSSQATNSPDPSIQAAAKAKAAAEAKAKAAAEAKAKAAAEAQALAIRQAQQESSRAAAKAAAAAEAKAAARAKAAQKASCLQVAQIYILSYQRDINNYENDLADLEIEYREVLASGDFAAAARVSGESINVQNHILSLQEQILNVKAQCG